MNREELEALPVVVDVPTAARVLRLSRSVAYQQIAAGTWPTPILRVGRQIRIPTAPLVALLGLDSPAAARPAA